MNKAKKKGFWFYFGRVMACIGIALLLPILYVYLSVPTYSFKEPKPFSGEYLYNPYQDMNPKQWKKHHFHCHSRKYFGLTNGRKNTESTIDSVYQALGYDLYGISDYMYINPHGSDRGWQSRCSILSRRPDLHHQRHRLCVVEGLGKYNG